MLAPPPNEGIELLYTRDCAAWREALQNLEAVCAELGIDEPPRLVAIDTLDQARLYNFFASPTIHVHGVDIDPGARRVSRRAVGAGRPYFSGGRAWPAPPRELIRTGLSELWGAGERSL